MAPDTIARFTERLTQSRAAVRNVLEGAVPSPPCLEDRIGCAFRPGMRVFDRVSGQEGEVIAGTRENVLVPTPKRNDG